MKTLLLLRHAKSSWHDPGLNDFDRPLNPRGLRNAPLIGGYMANHGYVPDVILCSSSRRTLETLSLIKPFLGLTIPTQIEDGLYLASARMLISTINEIDNGYGSALVIAHNPGLEDCVGLLTDEEHSTRQVPEALPTAGLALLRFSVPDWESVADGEGELLDFAAPKSMDAGSDE